MFWPSRPVAAWAGLKVCRSHAPGLLETGCIRVSRRPFSHDGARFGDPHRHSIIHDGEGELRIVTAIYKTTVNIVLFHFNVNRIWVLISHYKLLFIYHMMAIKINKCSRFLLLKQFYISNDHLLIHRFAHIINGQQ